MEIGCVGHRWLWLDGFGTSGQTCPSAAGGCGGKGAWRKKVGTPERSLMLIESPGNLGDFCEGPLKFHGET